MGRFTGTVAMISGGARGMGASHARALADEGASVVIGDVLDSEGKSLADEIGAAATFVHLDVTSSNDWTAAFATAEERYGSVNLLINNAGIVGFGSVEQTTPEDFRRIIDVNLTGTFLGMHHGITSLRRAGGGAIINVSSTAGMLGRGNVAGYVASKWGVRGSCISPRTRRTRPAPSSSSMGAACSVSPANCPRSDRSRHALVCAR